MKANKAQTDMWVEIYTRSAAVCKAVELCKDRGGDSSRNDSTGATGEQKRTWKGWMKK